jgi:hypothetical protein
MALGPITHNAVLKIRSSSDDILQPLPSLKNGTVGSSDERPLLANTSHSLEMSSSTTATKSAIQPAIVHRSFKRRLKPTEIGGIRDEVFPMDMHLLLEFRCKKSAVLIGSIIL